MTQHTNTTSGAADLPEALRRSTAADGKTELFNLPGYPLMVRAVDFNRIHAESEMRRAALLDEMQKAALAAGQATAAPAQPAAQQGVAYAALPEEGEPWRGHKFKEVQRGCWRCDCGKTIKEVTSDQSTPASGGNYPVMPKRYTVDDDGEELFTAEKMRAFADATHTLRASHGQAPAGEVILFEHEDGRYAINPDTTGDPAWHRLGHVELSVIAAPAQPGLTDAYVGAREDLSIWKRRALEAEATVRNFVREANSPTFMGDPASDECHHGDAYIVNDCLRCGAPVCCGKCCAAEATPSRIAAQQGVAYAALPESFLEIPDVQDESGINAYYSREAVLECIDAALASHGQAPAQPEGISREDWIEQAVRVYLIAGDTDEQAQECAAYLWGELDMDDLADPYDAAMSDIEGRNMPRKETQ